VQDGVVRCALPARRIFGRGGAPIWSKTLFDQACIATKDGARIGVIVGDFRFGNSIALQVPPVPRDEICDGHRAITRAALTPAHDAEMFERGMAALRLWHHSFGGKARYLFWDLFGRQVQDRISGRHMQDGVYHHPVFNYAEVVAALPDLDIIDLAPLLHLPMHQLQRLFIDGSLHPSQIGYLLLNSLFCEGQDALSAYKAAVAEAEGALFDLAQRAAAAKGGRLVLTGRSVWLDTLLRTLGRNGVLRLAKAGLILLPFNRIPGQLPTDRAAGIKALESSAVVVLSAGGVDLAPNLARRFDTTAAAWADIACFDWETASKSVILARNKTPLLVHKQPNRPQASHLLPLKLAAHMVEQGPLGLPSWAGLCHLLELIASGAVPVTRPDVTQPDITRPDLAAVDPAQTDAAVFTAPVRDIRGGAVLTHSGIAYLIGGKHAVLKYVTGALTPTPQSRQIFFENIAARRKSVEACGARYGHVIFPDKHSVLTEDFPFQPVHRLGDLYMSDIPAGLASYLAPAVLYPAHTLRQDQPTAYSALDTHLTAHGALAVLRMMLARVGIEAGAVLDHVQARITTTRNRTGDLGNKFAPPLFQDELHLDPDWPRTELRRPGMGNDGMVDIRFNPTAAHDITVLLFGDSFFYGMLPHLSAVFSRVILLRTRFMHSEMLALIKPDVVFTGNAERYLAYVAPDSDAFGFELYSELRQMTPLREDAAFLAAWRAVTSPRSAFAHDYFAGLGFKRPPIPTPNSSIPSIAILQNPRPNR
jgi:hypothetical protein